MTFHESGEPLMGTASTVAADIPGRCPPSHKQKVNRMSDSSASRTGTDDVADMLRGGIILDLANKRGMMSMPDQNSSIENVRLTARVEGIVQAVGFRYWTQRKADELGLIGTVGNNDDGSVAVVVEGPQHLVLQFRNWLRSDGTPGRVDNVKDTTSPATGEFKNFWIM